MNVLYRYSQLKIFFNGVKLIMISNELYYLHTFFLFFFSGSTTSNFEGSTIVAIVGVVVSIIPCVSMAAMSE